MKLEVYDLKEPVFHSAVTLVVNCTFEQCQKWLKKYSDEDLKECERFANGVGLHLPIKNKDGQNCHVIWLKKFEWTIYDMSVLVHELVHLVTSLLDQKQVPIGLENDETMAYLLEYYTYESFHKLKVHSKNYKRKLKRKKK